MILREFFGVISEAKCPECGSEGAYVGLNDVECQNRSCRHHKSRPRQKVGKLRNIDFDLAHDGPWQDCVSVLDKLFPGQVRVNPNGPGGGNPQVMIDDVDDEGAEELNKLLKKWGFDETDADWVTSDNGDQLS